MTELKRAADAVDPRWLVAAPVTAAGGLVMLVLSFTDWLRYVPVAEGAPSAFDLRGMGGTLPDGTTFGDWRPAAWTAVAGGVLILAAVSFAYLRGSALRSASWVAASAAAAALGLLIFVISNPWVAFGLQDANEPGLLLTAEGGVWGVFAGAVLALVGSVTAVGLSRGR